MRRNPLSQVGYFDTFNNYFLPGSGHFDNFFRKYQNFHPVFDPPPQA